MKDKIEIFIQQKDKTYIDSFNMTKMNVNYEDFSSHGLTALVFYIGLEPKSVYYGKIVGFFEYEHDLYEFWFHIHKPNQKYAHLSNQMSNIMRLLYDEKNNIYTTDDLSDFAVCGAFWKHTPLSKLTHNEDIAARNLLICLRKYSVTNKLCKKLRKTDKAHIAWKQSRDNRGF